MREAAPVRLIVFTSRWGEPTETFIRRETSAALLDGVEVVAVSLRRPASTADASRVVYIRPVAAVLVGALQIVMKGSLRRGLGRVVRSSHRRNVPVSIGAYLYGAAAARRVRADGWIHAHFAWVASTAADSCAAARDGSFSIFAHAHDIFDRRMKDGYTQSKLRRAALVLVESQSIADEVSAVFGCGAVVQRMGVPESTVVSVPPKSTSRSVVSVGTLLPKKGHDDLIRAVAQIPNATLEIVGDGPMRAELEVLAASLRIEDRVVFAGSLSPTEVVKRLDQAAVFCLASKPSVDGDRDGVPNALIEAMARGIPVVSTRLSGIPDLLGDGRGLLVDPEDVSGLAAALRSALDQPSAAAAQAELALRHVREYYTTERNWELLRARITAAGC